MPDRIVRDELWRNYRFLGLASNDTRLLYLALLNLADDYGNASAHPMAIKSISLIFASWDNTVVVQHMNSLHDADLIRMYQVDGECYLHIPRFKQRLRHFKTKHPRPPVGIECKEIKELDEKVRRTTDERQTHDARREEKRREEKGREVKIERGTRLQIDALPDEWEAWCSAQAPHLNPHDVFQKFRDYWIGVAGSKGVKLDWFATWRNFCRTERSPATASKKPSRVHAGVDADDKWMEALYGHKPSGANPVRPDADYLDASAYQIEMARRKPAGSS